MDNPNQTAKQARETTLISQLTEIDANKDSFGEELSSILRRRAWEIAIAGEVADQTQTSLSPEELRQTLFGNHERR